MPPLDLVIEGGDVIDGSAAPRVRQDVGVRDGVIERLGDLRAVLAQRRIDARGRIVAPGFIDAHSHDDRLLLEPPADRHPKLMQGVTTVVAGNCGWSLAPLRIPFERVPPPLREFIGRDDRRFARFGDYLAAVRGIGPATNAAFLVGHTTLRAQHVRDLDRAATPAETAAMAREVEEALEAGAIGLSTGVFYAPARAATAHEMTAVGAPLRAHGGLIAMHIRDESDAIDEALHEALGVGRALGVPLVISHHKLTGLANHGRSAATLHLLARAAQGQPVCIDCYPYAASSTLLIPARVGQSARVRITWSEPMPQHTGRELADIAAEMGLGLEQAAQRLCPAGAVYFSMDEADVRRILAAPGTMVGSDGLPNDVQPHPRLWGAFPRVLGHYARDLKLFALETAVHKMTGLPAARFGLAGRGRIAAGCAADLVVFDAARIADRASYDDPLAAPAGIDAVLVNGRVAVAHGVLMDAHAGMVLRRG